MSDSMLNRCWFLMIFQGDITNYEDVEAAFQGADCVYHLASYGMSGREQVRYGCYIETH